MGAVAGPGLKRAILFGKVSGILNSLSMLCTISIGTEFWLRWMQLRVEEALIDYTSLPTVFPRFIPVRSRWKI